MQLHEIEYALAKQIPLGSQRITFATDYGQLTLEGEAAQHIVTAVRRVLIQHASKAHAELTRD